MEVENFICDICEKELISKKKLTIHKKIHEGVWYVCGIDDCPFKRRKEELVNRHKAMTHKIEKFFYECDIEGCSFICKDKYGINRHKKNTHDIGVIL